MYPETTLRTLRVPSCVYSSSSTHCNTRRSRGSETGQRLLILWLRRTLRNRATKIWKGPRCILLLWLPLPSRCRKWGSGWALGMIWIPRLWRWASTGEKTRPCHCRGHSINDNLQLIKIRTWLSQLGKTLFLIFSANIPDTHAPFHNIIYLWLCTVIFEISQESKLPECRISAVGDSKGNYTMEENEVRSD